MKTVLITGVCGGMGHAAASKLLAEGWRVFGIDRSEHCDLPIHYHQTDITDPAALQQTYAAVSREAEHLDAICHFAGLYNMDSLVEIDQAEFERIFQINLFGIYRVNRVFFPMLRKGSRILMTSSELAPLDPLPFTGLYAITKTAVEKYAFSLRMELNLQDIQVIVLRPGAVSTGMLGASTTALDRLCRNTKIYRYNAARFRRIVNSVETKNIPPEKIARIAHKALTARRPRYVYNVNRNVLLRLLNALPPRLQVAIITGILKTREK